jgi:proteic killer suppression protein
MIRGFKCKETEKIFRRKPSRAIPPDVHLRARKKLIMLDAATALSDLKEPPANHLEALRGKLKGRYSIRINAQWRICFRWQGTDAVDVEIVDYH